MARLDLGVIEDVVEDLQQGFTAVLDGGQIAPLDLAQVGILQQGQPSQNAVHGSANFVAHGGEKDRLGPIGLFGLGAGLPLLLNLLIEPLVGVAELAGALLDPRLQLALIAAQLHRIVTKHLQGPSQLRQLIAARPGDRLKGSQIPVRQPAHPLHRVLQRPDDAAVDHAPHQQHQQHQGEQAYPHQGLLQQLETLAQGLLALAQGVAGTVDQVIHLLVEAAHQGLIGAGQHPQRLPLAEPVAAQLHQLVTLRQHDQRLLHPLTARRIRHRPGP
ncbi:hypothetical protein D3C77_345700 [compost metagenome]